MKNATFNLQSLPAQVKDAAEASYWHRIYLDNLRKAQEKNINTKDYAFKTLLLLARYCHETGMPQALAEGYAASNGELGIREVLVRDIFATEYEKEMRKTLPNRHLNATALLTRRTANFLNVHFKFRRNVLNGIVEYRLNDGSDFEYHTLTPEVMNTMTLMALESGLNSWDKDLKRYIHSTRVPEYDPINDWLNNLPAWDGTDRIAELAGRVPTSTEGWADYFHRWMLSMVAQWMERDDTQGNAIAPILIGDQATGKSSFCRILLPECLQDYYNDSIHFKDDKSVYLALTSFALVNIDEFDSLSKRQQPILKYLLSKSDVKYRAAYRNCIENHKRYASFIATTNSSHPLNDPTGSRRFICVKVEDPIDFITPVDYEQVYAQLKEEVLRGDRYWFTKEECDIITNQNAFYQRTAGIETLLLSLYRHPIGEENEFSAVPVDDIVSEIRQAYPTVSFAEDINTQVGKALTKCGFAKCRTHSGRKYKVVRR